MFVKYSFLWYIWLLRWKFIFRKVCRMEDLENEREMVFGRFSLSLMKCLMDVLIFVWFLYGCNWVIRRLNIFNMVLMLLLIFVISIFSCKKLDEKSRWWVLIIFISIFFILVYYFCILGCILGIYILILRRIFFIFFVCYCNDFKLFLGLRIVMFFLFIIE